MKFYSSSNNGVTAVISEDDAKIHEIIVKSGGRPAKVVKVFTFHDNPAHAKEFPVQYAVYTGTLDDLKWLIKQGGHELVDECGPWNGFVPFSNGHSIAETSEADYVTTLGDVRRAFFS